VIEFQPEGMVVARPRTASRLRSTAAEGIEPTFGTLADCNGDLPLDEQSQVIPFTQFGLIASVRPIITRKES
jgi:hypothetical protein